MRAGAQNRGQLGVEQFRLFQAQANGAQAKRGVDAVAQRFAQRRGQFFAADIERAHGQGASVEFVDEFAQSFILFVLVRASRACS